MTERDLLQSLTLPVMVAPMFLVSGPELLLASCRAGVIGSLPTPNARDLTILTGWLDQIQEGIATIKKERGEGGERDERDENDQHAPLWLLNMIVHRTYDRFDAELELVKQYQPPLVTTALGSPKRVVADVHAYGGKVFADVTNVTLAKKAIDAGVDGLILVCHGAGGHTGLHNPFAFIAEVRKFWDGYIGLSGGIMNGRDLHACKVLGADFSVMGTRFIGAKESLVVDDYRTMLVESDLTDVITSDKVSGVPANWLKKSLEKSGVSIETLPGKAADFSGNIANDKKAWRDIWSAGEGVGQITTFQTVSEIVATLLAEYEVSLGKKGRSPA